jgi:hypothetical protein
MGISRRCKENEIVLEIPKDFSRTIESSLRIFRKGTQNEKVLCIPPGTLQGNLNDP